MRTWRIFLSLCAAGMTVAASAAADGPDSAPQTMLSCYHLALKRSETLVIHKEMIEEAEGRIQEALSGVFPEISYVYSYERQDDSGQSSSSRETIDGKFTVSHTLFSGFKEFAAIAAGRSHKEQKKYELVRARQLLLKDVADAFYTYLYYQQDMAALEEIRGILSQRLEELKKREALGRSRLSEIASVRARISRLEAQIESVRGSQEVAGQLLEFLTGEPVEVLADDAAVEGNLGPLENYLGRVRDRADVLALREAWKKTQEDVVAARAGYWPEVTLDGNQYTKRGGSSTDIDWDVAVGVDVPLFQAGETAGLVRQARAAADQAALQHEKAQRSAVVEIKNAYSRFEAAVRRHEAAARALEETQKNYDLQLEDFRVNLVNNLDVLQALEDLQDSRRDFIAVQNEMKQLYWRLRVAVGEVPDDAF